MKTVKFTCEPECAEALDAQDELAPFRSEFHLPMSGAVPLHYLCGHSLGPMPQRAAECVDRELKRWAELAVEGHFGSDGWLDFHARFSAPLAQLAGAEPDEVVVMNTLTVNLHLMMASFFRPENDRYKILIERGAFPSDRYAVQSQLQFHGLDCADALLEFAPEPDSGLLDAERFDALLEAEGERTALVLLPGVQYLTGQVLDIGRYVKSARRFGCRIGFDLAHAIGNVPLHLHDWGPDFAVWCNYKYLNAGPGAVAACFVHGRWSADRRLPRLAGWWGHDESSRFSMPASFVPIAGAQGWQVSNPPILSLAPLAASLELFTQARLARLREKSLRLGEYFAYLLEHMLGDRVRLLTPVQGEARGNQMSTRVACAAGRELTRAMREHGVVVDCRPPDILRLAASPLYNRFDDVYRAVCALERVIG